MFTFLYNEDISTTLPFLSVGLNKKGGGGDLFMKIIVWGISIVGGGGGGGMVPIEFERFPVKACV